MDNDKNREKKKKKDANFSTTYHAKQQVVIVRYTRVIKKKAHIFRYDEREINCIDNVTIIDTYDKLFSYFI